MTLVKKSYIFGIGMNKTGTSSLKAALCRLGIPCLHSSTTVKRVAGANRKTGRRPLYSLDQKFAAFCDSPINRMFRDLDAAYPGSKFILTVRDMRPWLISRVCHHGKSVDFHRKAWASHVPAVMDYFSERKSDLLVYDLCGGDGWKPLCDFLGVPIPAIGFPRKNKTGMSRHRRIENQISKQL